MDIEKFIRSNRAELDEMEELESDVLWHGIQQELRHDKWRFQIGTYWRWSIAASILVLSGVAWWWYQSSEISTTDSVSITAYYPELAQTEQSFQQQINEKKQQLNFSAIDRQAFQEIFMELEILDQIHQEYLDDISIYQDNDQLARTLIKYYERKIQILERLSKEIDKKAYNEKLKYEKRI